MKLTKRKDGRWQYKFNPGNGQKIKVLYSSEPNEKKAEKDILKKIALYEADEIRKTLFKSVAEKWSAEHFETLENNSLKTYKPALDDAISYFDGEYIQDITSAKIKAYLQYLIKRKYAYKTVSNKLLVVNLICKHAVIEGYIEHNPCQYIQAPKNLVHTTRDAASSEDLKKIKEHVDEQFGLFIYFIMLTGCRRGEALALTPKDIDFENKIVYINNTVEWIGNKPQIKPRPKSKAGERAIPLPDALIEKLLPLRNQKYLFPNDKGELMSNSQVTRWLNKYKKNANIEATPHPIRHAYSSMLYEAGVDLKTMQNLLGHSDIQTTMNIYTHLTDKKKQESSQKLLKYLDKNF